MGCWSESCIISGLEIRHTDPCGMVYITSQTDYMGRPEANFKTPIVWGKYNDYGDLEDIQNIDKYVATGMFHIIKEHGEDKLSPVFLSKIKKDDDTFPRKPIAWPVFIHRAAFEALETIPSDSGWTFPNSDGTVGDYTNKSIEKFKEGFSEYLGTFLESEESTEESRLKKLMKQFVNSDWHRHLKSSWSLAAFRDSDFDITQDVDFLLGLLRDEKLVTSGMADLRKGIPMHFHGPQHGGGEALLKFNEAINAVCKKVMAEYDDDYYPEDEE